jgi:hypothetical protein
LRREEAAYALLFGVAMTCGNARALIVIAFALPMAACAAAAAPAQGSTDGSGARSAFDDGGNAADGAGWNDAGQAGEPGDAALGVAPPRDGSAPEDAAIDSDGSDRDAVGIAASRRESLVWVWMDYPQSLAAVAANASSFTHVSPSLYDVNYDYASGVAEMQSDDGPDSFDGLSSAQIATQIHAAGMKCIPLIQGGAANTGTDQGIQNIIGDSPKGTQAAFISSMVQEAVTKGYDGYSLDWEVGGSTDYATYGAGFVSFLGAFQAALHQDQMQLTLIVGDWFVEQSNCSGGTGLVDLAGVAPNVDQVIVMDYMTTLGTPPAACTASVSNPQNCGNDFGSDMNLMCAYVPEAKINIGFDSDPSAGNNGIAGACVSATQVSGISAVSIWPEYNTAGANGSYAFCDTTNISPAGATWFGLLAGFVADK